MSKLKSFYDLGTDPQGGQRVKVTRLQSLRGVFITPRALETRQAGARGTVTQIVPGHGGDYWFVAHDGGKLAAYSTKELCPVRYPPAFIEKVRAALPAWPDLDYALERGSEMVGLYLDGSSSTAIEAKDVLAYIKRRQIKQLRQEATRRLRLRELYGEWQRAWEKMEKQ